MGKKKDKQAIKALGTKKRFRRSWITFLRILRYGTSNFRRNIWLTVAATAVMTITLLVIFTTIAAREVLLDTVGEIRDRVDMSIYVKTDTTSEDADTIRQSLQELSSVKRVTYISPSDARQKFAQSNKDDINTLEALNESTNQFPGTFRVVLVDINNVDELKDFVANDDTLKKNINPKRTPSFAGQRKSAIDNIGRWVGFAERAGLVASVLFTGISSLIVFNTIRMAIFNRKEEIQMMKLIGADKGFIRGPFIVEAAGYGFIAAIIATVLGMLLLRALNAPLLSYGISMQGLNDMAMQYAWLIAAAMIGVGSMIGVASSMLATRRYLKL